MDGCRSVAKTMVVVVNVVEQRERARHGEGCEVAGDWTVFLPDGWEVDSRYGREQMDMGKGDSSNTRDL